MKPKQNDFGEHNKYYFQKNCSKQNWIKETKLT